MGPFKKIQAAPEVQQTVYFTEVGAPNENWENVQQEITQVQYSHLYSAIRTAEAIYFPFSHRAGNPQLYMDVLHDEKGHAFSRSRIQLWTEEENERLSPLFEKPEVKVVRMQQEKTAVGSRPFWAWPFMKKGQNLQTSTKCPSILPQRIFCPDRISAGFPGISSLL